MSLPSGRVRSAAACRTGPDCAVGPSDAAHRLVANTTSASRRAVRPGRGAAVDERDMNLLTRTIQIERRPWFNLTLDTSLSGAAHREKGSA